MRLVLTIWDIVYIAIAIGLAVYIGGRIMLCKIKDGQMKAREVESEEK